MIVMIVLFVTYNVRTFNLKYSNDTTVHGLWIVIFKVNISFWTACHNYYNIHDIPIDVHVMFMTLHTIGQGRSCITGDGDVQIYQTNSFGSVDNAGRVEICLGGVWGTIAADSITTPWSEKNAQVACIQAGFGGVLNVILQETYIYLMISCEKSVPISGGGGGGMLLPL